MDINPSLLINTFSIASIAVLISTYGCIRYSDGVKNHDDIVNAVIKDRKPITFALYCSILVTVPIALELALDIFLKWKSSIKDHGERILMILFIVIPSVVLIIYEENSDTPYLFICMHLCQYIGCFGAIISLCNKLAPRYFTVGRMILVQFFFSISSIFLLLSYEYEHLNWRNYSSWICLIISYIIFLTCMKRFNHIIELKS